ncbi:1784_t:CDS:2 [Racocetra fulgida]|uniref:1784_t:CDS:1 n=1 Tax=Racocetra fulgida TaxID=60492 RepID=A0A9N9I6Z8_9GLOM|nr:1784_t:CDS:2 [Racocetra fulgida]
MFADFKLATEGKLRSVEPNVIRSNNLEVLLTSINNNHWDIFNVLNKKKPESLTELAKLLNQAMGIVKLKKEGKETRPIVLYDEIKLLSELTIMTENKNNQTEEMTFLVIANQPGVKEEITRQDIQRALISQQEFIEKNLSQNSILNSAIIGERKGLVMVKVHLSDETTRETIRKANGIDVTEAIFQDEKTAKEYRGYEF